MAATGRVFLLCLLGLSCGQEAPLTFELDGKDWILRSASMNVSNVAGVVPGQAHLDLMRVGIIGDPYWGYNERDYVWIANENWIYTKKFMLSSAGLLDYDYVWLRCDGLDTVANISVNGPGITSVPSSQYRRYFFDNVKDLLKEGSNSIEVSFESPVKYANQLNSSYPYNIPTYVYSQYIKTVRNFIRKAQSDFGWDWGPAFAPVGIWRSISLVGFNAGLVTDVVPQVSYNKTGNVFLVSTLVCALVPDKASFPVALSAFVVVATENGIEDVKITSGGETCLRVEVPISSTSVRWWYPNGYGDQPTCAVTANVTLTDSGGKKSVQSFEKRVGFRDVQLVRDPLPDGETFYFRVNEIPVFVKGSNLIPLDAFESRVTSAYLRKVLQAAVVANQNMVRVWGGGIYQRDEFYDICDELGLMVWQEFMFAVSLYPRDKDFLDNVAHEVKDQVRRLSHHPSIVLWSGNNENQDIASGNGATYIVDYSVLYDKTVHTTLLAEDTTRPYWPASPSNGFLVEEPAQGLLIQRWGSSQDTHYGDVHRYDYDHLCTDVTRFPRPRFASEFGYQSYPSIHAWLQVSNTSMWGNDSPFMNQRQHHQGGNKELETFVKNFTRLPDSSNATRKFEDFVYLTQVVQSVCIEAEIEHYRRIRNESWTMGTLYWQLNDVWQAQTWASLEYGGRWKLLHYGVKRAYNVFLISAYLLEGNVSVYLVTDYHKVNLQVDFAINVIGWDGGVKGTFGQAKVELPMLSSKRVWSEPLSVVFKNCQGGSSGCFLHLVANLTGSSTVLCENTFYPTSLAAVNFSPPSISIADKAIKDNMSYFSLESKAVAPFVYLYTKVDGYFSDNGFLLMPGKKTLFNFTGDTALDPNTFWDELQVKSIRDTYQ